MEPPCKLLRLEGCPGNAPGIQPKQATPSAEEITETDLPLLANVNDVRVVHYLLQLKTDFAKKVITGSAILFMEWLKPEAAQVVLDMCCLNVKQVSMLKSVTEYDMESSQLFQNKSRDRKDFYKNENTDWFQLSPSPGSTSTSSQLQFSVDKWSLNISGWDNLLPPSVIRIDYETAHNSPSIHWRPCEGTTFQAGSSTNCLYSPAPPVNNRGLFPCQEPPSAMATWEVVLDVENGYTPLLTSDEPGQVIQVGDASTLYYFFTSIPLPMSTFAMVIGNFYLESTLVVEPTLSACNEVSENHQQERAMLLSSSCSSHIAFPCHFSNHEANAQGLIPVRLFSLDKETSSGLNLEKLSAFVRHTLQTCFENLGPHPFSRLDLVIMPKCFPHMGLANPYMIFLSSSNFSGSEEPLFVTRLPHEICHSWFGLLIGALDWTEEWLSEGFATFCEDILFQATFQHYFPDKTPAQVRDEQGLKICLRFITLQNELQHTDSEFQVLSWESAGKEKETTDSVKNGLVPLKQFMHTHYYKGYLLLWHLSFIVGHSRFVQFLKDYVHTYHGQLVTSEIFLTFYAQKFESELSANGISIEKIRKEWLESNALPELYNKLDLLQPDLALLDALPIFESVTEPLKRIKLLFEAIKKGGAEVEQQQLVSLSSTELLILMEHVLAIPEGEEEECLERCYAQFSSLISPSLHNPEIIHRWCELCIKVRDRSKLAEMNHFLKNNIAMGVYLYGELMISEKASFQRLARGVFQELQGLYDMGTKRLLKDMIF